MDLDLGLIEVAWSDPNTGQFNRDKLFNAEQHQQIVREIEVQNAFSNQNVYLSAGLQDLKAPTSRRGTASSASCLTAIWADFDDGRTAETALKTVRAWGIPPTLVVQTGEHPSLRAQFWWRLDTPTPDLAGAKSVMTALATLLNGDKAVSDVGRVMRAAGSIAWPKKTGRLIEQTRILHDWAGDAQSYDYDELVARIPVTHLPAATAKPSISGLSGSRRTQKERLKLSKLLGQWHCNIRDYVPHMVHGGATMETILRWTLDFGQGVKLVSS